MKKIVWIMNTKDQTGLYNSSAVIWWYGILENLGYEVVYYAYEQYNIEELYELIKDYRPDFTIIAAYNRIHTELIRIREFTKVYVLQSDDKWRYDNFSKFWIPFIDGVITYAGELNKYVSDGLKKEQFNLMRWGFNPVTMAKTDFKLNTQFGVSHTGGLHSDRINIINEFRSKGINVEVNQNPNYDVTKAVWNNSKYSLCLTSNSTNTVKDTKGRIVEIPNWCVLLTQSFPEAELYYDTINELVMFDSVDEAIEKMKYLDAHPDEYEKIKIAGKRKLWNSNTAYHEWNKILPNIDPDYKQLDITKILKENHKEYYYI